MQGKAPPTTPPVVRSQQSKLAGGGDSGPAYYWVPDNHEVWSLGVQTVEGVLPNGCIRVELVHNKKSQDLSATHLISTSSYFTDQHACSTVEDLVSLPEVNQPAILFTTKARFFNKKIYTSLGQVLMLVNPFEKIQEYYGAEVIDRYKNPYAENLPSHLYLVPSRAYNAMITFHRNQSILISGESGAGKTEATKECITFLTKLSISDRSEHTESSPSKRPSVVNSRALHIAEATVAVSPILEAFGNAQTLRNPNSSRFGKWLELIFDDTFRITGSTITSYLLEKSRVTQHDSKERNFHIFYQLIRSGDQKLLRKFHLVPNTKTYKYLSSDGATESANLNDAARYKETIESFSRMGFSKDLQDSIFRIVSAILILGNVKFDDNNTSDGGAIISRSDGGGAYAAEMLKISQEQLELCLCTRNMLSGGIRKSIIQMKLTKETATFARDTLARTLYEKLFEYIIGSINTNNANSVGNIVSSSIKSVDIVNTVDSSSTIDLTSNNLEDKFHIIGLLDIFGFEIFETNSFEQLCINYCNEMLQDHFNYVIFTMEKQLYSDEGISCETIEFKDNAMTIKEIVTLFKLLDEEGRVKGTSKSWYEKHKRQNSNTTNKKIAAIISYPVKKDVFTIKHYAGIVEYSPIDFLEKNSEVVTNEITSAMKSSECPVISDLFGGGAASSANPATEAAPDKASVVAPRGPSQLHSSTISYVFQKQLNSLMVMLKSCDSHFIRCIKSNEECKPMAFDHSLVQRQLLYSGIFEIIKIQQSGLPVRLKHLEFVDRFRCLIKSNNRWDKMAPKNLLEYLRKTLGVSLQSAQLGNNLVFFKGSEFASIEAKKLEIQTACVIRIQSRSRMYNFYKNYRLMLVFLRQFTYYVSDIDYDNCAKSASEIIQYCNAISKLDEGILNHLVRKIEVKLKKVSDQFIIINELASVRASRSAENFEKINVLLKRAIDLSLSGHKLVSEVSSLHERYQTAKEFGKKVKTENKKALKVMSLDAVDLGIKCMDEFSDVIPGAQKIVDEAEHWKHRIENEVTKILNPLMSLFESEKVSFDHKSGQIIIAKFSDGLTRPGADLKTFFMSLNANDLECQDTRLLFEDVRMFLKIRDEFVPYNRGHDAIDLIESYQPSFDIAKEQFLVLHHWSECHLADKLLRDRLKIGPIPASSTGKETPTAVNHIIELRDSISLVEQGEKVNNVLKVAEHLIKMRSAFIDGDFTVLRDMLKLAENEQKILSRFSEYPDILVEMSNAYWQIIHNIALSDLVHISTMQVFNSLVFNSDDWTCLVVDFDSCQKAIDEAVVFAFPSENDATANIEAIVTSPSRRINSTSKKSSPCPYLMDMIEVTRLILSARNDFYEDALSRSEAINTTIATLIKEYADVMKHVGIFQLVSNETAICLDLLQSLRLEDSLHAGLTYSRTKPFVYSSDSETFVYDPSLVGDTASLSDAIGETVDFLDSTIARGDNYHIIANSLQNQVKIATAILKGRQMLLGYELIDGLTFDKIDVLLNEFKAIEEDEEYGSVLEQYRFEFNIIISELIRRQVIYKLRSVLNAKVITGILCVSISANKEAYENCFAQLQSVNETINKKMPLIPTNVAILQKLCSILMDLRKAVKDDRFEDDVLFDTFLEALESSNQDIVIWAECGNYYPEITCVKSEYEVRRDVKILKASLAQHPVDCLRAPSERCSMLFYDETIKFLTTEHIRKPCEKLSKYIRVNEIVRDLIVLSSHYVNLITAVKKGNCIGINVSTVQVPAPIVPSDDVSSGVSPEEKAALEEARDTISVDEENELYVIESLCRKHGIDDMEYSCLKKHVIVTQLFKSINNALNKTVRLNNNNTVFHNTVDYSSKVTAVKEVLKVVSDNDIKLPASYTKWINIIINYVLLLESIPKQEWLLIIGRARCVEEVVATVQGEVLYDPLHQELILKYIMSDTKVALLLSLELREVQKKVKSHMLPDEVLITSPHRRNPNLTGSYGSSTYVDLNDTDSSTESLRDDLLDSLSTPYKTPLSAYFAKLHDYYYHSGSPIRLGVGAASTIPGVADDTLDNSTIASSIQPMNNSLGGDISSSELLDVVHSVTITERDRVRRKELLIAQDNANPYGIHNLRRAGYDDSDLVEGNYPLEVFWAVGIDAAVLRKKCRHSATLLAQAGYDSAALFEANYSLKELKSAGFSADDIRNSCNVSIRDIKRAGFTIIEILDSGFTSEHLKAAGYDAHKLLDMQIDVKQLLKCGFSLFELRAADVTAHQLKQAGVTDCKLLRSVGYDSVRLKSAGFDAAAMKSAGYNYYDLRAIGYHDERLLTAGFEADMTYDILCEFYRNLDGRNWINSKNWCSSRHMREWFGVTVDEAINNGYCVTAIRLPSNNLCGYLTDRICHLRHLRTLILGDNSLMGSVPQSIGLMKDLAEFDVLYNSMLEGNNSFISRSNTSGISETTSLTDVSRKGAPRTPADVTSASIHDGEWNALMDLFQDTNGGSWKNNRYWGDETVRVGNWFGVTVNSKNKVIKIVLNCNNLEGCLPDSIRALKYLQVLDLRFNNIIGSIPTSIGSLKKLVYVHLHCNHLTCEIPDSIGQLSHLKVLDLRSNKLMGVVPKCIAQLKHLSYIALSSNVLKNGTYAEVKQLLPQCHTILCDGTK